MAKVRYNIQTSNGRTFIRLVFRFGGVKFVYYPGIEVKPELWNSDTQEVRRNAPNHKELNSAIQRLRLETERIYAESLGRAIPLLPAELKIELDRFWKGRTALDSKPKYLTDFIRSMIAARVASGEITRITGKGFISLCQALDRFKKKIQLADVDLLFHKRFTAMLTSEGKAPNTIHSYIKRLRYCMGIAVDMGLTDNQSFRSRNFTSKASETDSVYLTAVEVELIESVDLSGRGLRAEEKARDLFLLGVYTGLRYSDFSSIQPEDFQTYNGVFMVKKRMKKTSKIVAVPIPDKARRILERYGMRSPVMSGQKLNKYIKRVCELAGIVEMVKYEQTRGGVRAVAMKPKFRMVSTHTARRTFATLEYIAAVQSGRPFDSIMDITGHSSRSTFLKYVRVSAEEKAAAFVKAAGG